MLRLGHGLFIINSNWTIKEWLLIIDGHFQACDTLCIGELIIRNEENPRTATLARVQTLLKYSHLGSTP